MKVIFTTGGTGGHIYPALALAKRLKEVNPNYEISFVGSSNRMEKDIIEKSIFDFYGYNLSSGMQSKFDKIKQYIQMVLALLKTYFKFVFNRPDLVIGFGAYITAPTLMAAKFLNIPIMLHEQNSSLGKVNKMFYKSADQVIVCYESLFEEYPDAKVKLLGNPRASEVKDITYNSQDLIELGLDPKLKTVLIVMGSQGSQSVNDAMFELMPLFSEQDFQVIYVTGKQHYDLYKSNIDIKNVVILPYVDQPQMLKNSDLVIARGGATTAAEICAIGVPSIIIPSPYVANNHQYINAHQLEKVSATKIIKEADLTAKVLLASIKEIIFDDNKLTSMKKAALSLSSPNASDDIIKLIKGYAND
ncbi:MAG: undecaprenyldiphospho-muramoylpentapeptide beta-N-acetylglucosaminyltransferase [Erysipelothrix sp.]|nr:undecaprenyldiphospho-muramoylpentapeptide beta-N-acetylglucosaminyltransferase [Erysipelothrix sp.]